MHFENVIYRLVSSQIPLSIIREAPSLPLDNEESTLDLVLENRTNDKQVGVWRYPDVEPSKLTRLSRLTYQDNYSSQMSCVQGWCHQGWTRLRCSRKQIYDADLNTRNMATGTPDGMRKCAYTGTSWARNNPIENIKDLMWIIHG